MLRNRLAAVAATAALAVASLTLATPAVAGDTGANTDGCGKLSFGLKAKESVKIRKTAKLSATAVGLLPKGKKACFIDVADGGKSGACFSGTEKVWNKVSYRGMKGWVPSQCVDVIRH